MMDFTGFLITNIVLLWILLIAVCILFFIIISKNPINIILLLIAFFFDLALLFIYCGADYLSVLILILYAGAILIILLFVVMLLDMKDLILQKDKIAKILICFYIFILLLLIFKSINFASTNAKFLKFLFNGPLKVKITTDDFRIWKLFEYCLQER